MIFGHIASSAFRLVDRKVIMRLPHETQRALVSFLLSIARRLAPGRDWPALPDGILARRDMGRPLPNQYTLPRWAVDDMAEIALTIDPALAPEQFVASMAGNFTVPVHWTQAGHIYKGMAEQLAGSTGFDTVILVPWLKRGGADLGALHHARACQEAFGHRVLVIATELGESPWSERLPAGVRFLEIGRDMAELSAKQREPEAVLARLLVQLAPARVHIINSDLAWRTLVRHGKALRQSSRVFASLYSDERDFYGRREGLAQRYLIQAVPWLDAVISDNHAAPREWSEMLGVAPDLFRVVHFPAPIAIPSADTDVKGSRLLWASRISREKRPDLLARIAASTPEYQWDVYGSHGADKFSRASLRLLRQQHNLTLHGRYDDFSSVVRSRPGAYIYTSAWDGLPNVLLEAAAAELPIVAPDVGGISDLVDRSLLLPADADAQCYAAAIRTLADPDARRAHLLLQNKQLKNFSWPGFLTSMRGIGGYT